MAYIKYKDVTFSYPEDHGSPALVNLNLQVEKGQFVVLFGPSGCGKSTLLRLLKKEIKPHGNFTGDILIDGQSIIGDSSTSEEIGYVFQDPENQVVAEEVLHELAFGLENIGMPTNEMRNRIAEMVNFMGAEHLLHRKTEELSGGQKQQLNLSSILLMQPNVLLLDEPTAQLDPVSAREFLDMIVRLNEEFGLTVIMAEHRLEEVLALADKIVMMKKGRVKLEGVPKQVLHQLFETAEQPYIPTIPSYYLKMNRKVNEVNGDDSHLSIPLTVKEGRIWLNDCNFNRKVDHLSSHHQPNMRKTPEEEIIRIKNVYFQYGNEKKDAKVLHELDFTLRKGEFYGLLGGNGSGKSTLLKLLCGIYKPQRGKIVISGKETKRWDRLQLVQKIGYLPQNPKLFFIQDTVEKEIQDTMVQWHLESYEEAETLLRVLGIDHLKNKHPYDLSGGELQKAALACILLRKPEILLLDEPTKGLDPVSKQQLAYVLTQLQQDGMTIMMTSHDVEFTAKYVNQCGMMFEGKITSELPPAQFFKGNFFYTTMIQRLFRGINDDIVTMEEEGVTYGNK